MIAGLSNSQSAISCVTMIAGLSNSQSAISLMASVKSAKLVSPVGAGKANKNRVTQQLITRRIHVQQKLITRRITSVAPPPYYTSTRRSRSRSSSTLVGLDKNPKLKLPSRHSHRSSSTLSVDQNFNATESEFPMISSSGNPCLDLYFCEGEFFKAEGKIGSSRSHRYRSRSHRYLKQLLPLAWSYNPPTTLKLICNLRDDSESGKSDKESFYTALIWLHWNHPKTLACNIEAIAKVGCLENIVELLCRLVDSDNPQKATSRVWICEKTIAIANKTVERYDRDPDFQLLYDRVSDIFSDYLKSDIEKLNKIKSQKKKKLKQQQSSVDHEIYDDNVDVVKFSPAVLFLPYTGYRTGTKLCESVARKVFPREEGYQGLEDAEYTYRVRSRLRKEVLLPARKRMMESHKFVASSKCEVKQYLEDMKAGRRHEIKIDDTEAANFFPHEILDYVDDPDVGNAAELLWKAMVEDLSNKGKWKNCLVVCDVSEDMLPGDRDVAVALALLLSQLSDQESWKEKVIPFAQNPDRLLQIEGNDLKSKCAFLRGMDMGSCMTIDIPKVFDLILQEAVSSNLKPEHMIKKVLFLTQTHFGFSSDHWSIAYEEIRSKFEEKGYTMPHIVFWNMRGLGIDAASRHFGVVTFDGFFDNFLKSFLENEGEVGPEHALEAAICGKQYQNLAVVD